MRRSFFHRFAFTLTNLFSAILSASGPVRAQPGDAPAISPPVVRSPVAPYVNQESAAGLPSAERYTPGGPVHVMPDLRLSDGPHVSPPVSPGVHERDLRKEPGLFPPDSTLPPRVMPDLKETPSNRPSHEGGGRSKDEQQ